MTHAFSNNLKPNARRHRGLEAEDWALEWLQSQQLTLLMRNFKSPGRGGGEIDLIMREPDTTVVFVEVRLRTHQSWGGAAASVSQTKQQRLIFAARHYLMRMPVHPRCRFDVVALHQWPPSAHHADWIRGAFCL
jgi:putative endonuclease